MGDNFTQADLVKLLITAMVTGFFMQVLEYSDFISNMAEKFGTSKLGVSVLMVVVLSMFLVWRY